MPQEYEMKSLRTELLEEKNAIIRLSCTGVSLASGLLELELWDRLFIHYKTFSVVNISRNLCGLFCYWGAFRIFHYNSIVLEQMGSWI